MYISGVAKASWATEVGSRKKASTVVGERTRKGNNRADHLPCPTFVEHIHVRTELKAATASTEEFLRPLRNTLARATRDIAAAERRLVRIPEDSLPVVLEELNEMKVHRDDLRRKISEGEKMSGGVIDPDKLEGKIRGRLESFWEVFVGKEAGDARAELAKHIDYIVVSHDKTAELFPKQDGLLVGLLPKVLLGQEVEQEPVNKTLPEDRESGLCGIPTTLRTRPLPTHPVAFRLAKTG